MIPNISINELPNMSIEDLVNSPLATIYSLLGELDNQTANLQKSKQKITDALEKKYGKNAREERLRLGQDTGTVNFIEGDFIVQSVVPKKVRWDQVKLNEILGEMKPEDARHYAKVDVSIEEKKFTGAPPAIQEALRAARTVEPQKTKYEIKLSKREVA